MIWTIVGAYFILVILLHIPAVQSFIGSEVGSALSKKFGTKVTVGSVDLGFVNRLIVDDVCMLDQKGKHMLTASRVSVKFDYFPLIKGKISISSAQLFGMKAMLYQASADAKPNFQFVIDSLASKDTTKHTPLDLQINSLIIRHGAVKYDRYDIAPQYGRISPAHLDVKDISAHIIVNALKDDSVNINLKKLSLSDVSGLQLQSMSFKLVANRQASVLHDFKLELPHSHIELGEVAASYSFMGKKIEMPSLQYSGTIQHSNITLSDLKCIIPELKNFKDPIRISSSLQGTSTSVRINELKVSSANRNIRFWANGSISNWNSHTKWFADIQYFNVTAAGIKFLSDNLGKKIEIPTFINRLGNIGFHGTLGGFGRDLAGKGTLRTDAGDANLKLGKHEQHFSGFIETSGLDLNKIINNNKFGKVITRINVEGSLPSKNHIDIKSQGTISRFDYNSYSYKNISVDGHYHDGIIDGTFGIDDPNGKIDLKGQFNTSATMPSANITAKVNALNIGLLNLSKKWQNTMLSVNVSADFKGKSMNSANGRIDFTDLSIKSDKMNYALSQMNLKAGYKDGSHFISMLSDFGHVDIYGQYDYNTLFQSITNFIGSKLPTIPGLPRMTHNSRNNFSIDAEIDKSDWLQEVFDIPLDLNEPLTISGRINDKSKQIYMDLNVPKFAYNNKMFENAYVHITTPNDTLKSTAHIKKISDNGQNLYINLNAEALKNTLSTSISFKNDNKLSGTINSSTQFFKTENGASAAHVNIHPSEILVGDTIWNVMPSDIVYSNNYVNVNNFIIKHNKQHIDISGLATRNPSDSLFVDIKDVDVNYIMNLVNFHAVSFSGFASGRAYVSGAFNNPQAIAKLYVDKFKFQGGRMGVLTANVNLNNNDQQIDINAIANDGPGSQTLINGYVSPKRNYIDLDIKALNTRVEFLESFCGSFMRNIDTYGQGDVRLFGPLNKLNLTGNVVANGTLEISSLNTKYTLKNDTITLNPNEIRFANDTIYDREGHHGIVTGNLYHNNLKNLSYNVNVKANNLLSYDFTDFGDNSFYGTVYATGNCNVKGKSGEVTINVNASPNKGSSLVYNVSTPDNISNNEFVHWESATPTRSSMKNTADSMATDKPSVNANDNNIDDKQKDIPTDIHLNFLVNCNPSATLKLIMDQKTGDYIGLNGSGTMRATYYNKGSFDLYGNYLVDHGIYKLTIQNVIKKDFQFNEGGTIEFGGDPYNAVLNLKAQYLVNGVSLSDLNLGKSFSSNNIRVNCIMNITGTPNTPKIDFELDMPTVNSEAKQMIYSLINSEEEMNQQVLYLLAIGRFYNQGNNNATTEGTEQQSQTSLAMQSILSGTLSQQINNVLSSVVNNTNWNFGANISTGNEGWNNAEYEGLLSGRLLNNRLLINGQFGYRDNANTTTSFIGDFDIRYLLMPSGNLAIKMYNQTNDRYFTRNSLNTQGIGLIMKKDFNGWRDLFGIKKKNKSKNKSMKK